MRPTLLKTAAALALAALLTACTEKNSADLEARQQASAATSVALGVDRLLLFPNPIGTDPFAQDGGTFETNTTEYANAYYAAIDPTNAKDTIDKWKAANLFDTVGNGTQHLAVFRDVKDLGYGRRMTGRRNTSSDPKVDGSVAFYVENYNVAPNGSAGYSSDLNVGAAIRRDTQWHVGTNAIEWTSTPCIPNYDPADCDNTGTVKFAKYYNFSSADGTRQLAVDLDGHGKKAMPGPCITCHGGRGDPLTPPDASGKPRFPLVENLPSRKRGDVGAHLHGQNVDSFTFSTTQAGFAKTDMQPFLKDFNQWILCTYPTPTAATVTGPAWGSCNRPLAGQNEWQGTAGPMIEAWYGGPGMPASNFSDTYVPAGWNTNTAIPGTPFTDTALYQGVVEPYCRTCHILRGTKNQNDIDFMTLGIPAAGVNPATGFQSLADRIKVHVFDRGNMPLALIPHSDFWNSSAPQMLAAFVDAQLGVGTATSNGTALMPGRAIADPGPDRMVRTGSNAVLTGENSLFAGSFAWSEPTQSGNVTITNPNNMVAIFNASVAGTYTVRLTVNGGGAFKDITVVANDNFPDPLNIKFAHVKNLLQNVLHKGTTRCVDCHKDVATPLPGTTPPIWYTNFDRDNDGALNATDEAWFLKAISGRVNLTEIAASPLLRKPTGNHHNAGKVIDVADLTGNGGFWNFSVLYNWIVGGMQAGGVAANPIVNGALPTVTATFGGSPLYSTAISVNGSTSVGATSFLWSALGTPGPNGELPVFANAAAANTSLNVPNTGTYTVQLNVDDGVSNDSVQRTLSVTEAAISASFSPSGNASTSFTGGFGDILLSSGSTYGGGGLPLISPPNCRWQVTPPVGVAGTTLDGDTVLDRTKPCTAAARLNVPQTAVGKNYSVQLTASALGSSSITQTVTPSNAAPSANLGNTVSQGVQFGGPSTTTIPTHTTNTGGTASTATISVVTGTAQLNGNLSSTPVNSLTYAWCLTSQPDSTNFAASGIATCPTTTSSGANPLLNFTVRTTGSYGVQLTVDNGTLTQSTATKTITISPPQGVTFATVAGIVGGSPCSGCHIFGTPLTTIFNTASGTNSSLAMPPWDNAPTLGNGTENVSLYRRLMQRVNLGSAANSLLVVCPSVSCDGGVMPAQGGNFVVGGSSYNNLLRWIQDGAPPGN
jgi:mono/diheme cytochrome c family protein